MEEGHGYRRRGEIDGVRSGNDRLKRAVEEKGGRRERQREQRRRRGNI